MSGVAGASTDLDVSILLVEDSPGDVSLTREAFRSTRLSLTLDVVHDGEAALRHVRGGADGRLPDLMLLDLNLPRMGGHEVLAQLKADPELCQIPVVVLTSSSADDDVVAAYRAHANSYVVKPLDYRDFIDAVRAIEGFWLSLARLPSEAPACTT